jgi:hypothetical protein
VPDENLDVAGFPSQGTISGISCERDDLRPRVLCHSISPALVGFIICGYVSGMGGIVYLDVFRALYGFMAVPAKS